MIDDLARDASRISKRLNTMKRRRDNMALDAELSAIRFAKRLEAADAEIAAVEGELTELRERAARIRAEQSRSLNWGKRRD